MVVAAHHVGVEGVERAGEFGFDEARPRLAVEAGVVGDADRVAVAGERLGRALLPEGVLERERHHDAARQSGREMADAGTEVQGPLAHVGEAALRRHPEHAVRLTQDGLADLQEVGGAAERGRVHADEPEAAEDAVLRQRRGVDRGELVAAGVGAAQTQRVAWVRQLSQKEAQKITLIKVLKGWDPGAVRN